MATLTESQRWLIINALAHHAQACEEGAEAVCQPRAAESLRDAAKMARELSALVQQEDELILPN